MVFARTKAAERALKPGGRLYLLEGHPSLMVETWNTDTY